MCLRESQRKKRKNDGEHEFKWIRWKEKYGDKNEGQWENQCRSQEPLQIPRRIDSGKSTPKHITVRTQIPKSTQSEKQPWRKDRPRAKGGSPDNSPSAALEARRSRVRSSRSWKKRAVQLGWPTHANIFVKEKREMEYFWMDRTESLQAWMASLMNFKAMYFRKERRELGRKACLLLASTSLFLFFCFLFHLTAERLMVSYCQHAGGGRASPVFTVPSALSPGCSMAQPLIPFKGPCRCHFSRGASIQLTFTLQFLTY